MFLELLQYTFVYIFVLAQILELLSSAGIETASVCELKASVMHDRVVLGLKLLQSVSSKLL